MNDFKTIDAFPKLKEPVITNLDSQAGGKNAGKGKKSLELVSPSSVIPPIIGPLSPQALMEASIKQRSGVGADPLQDSTIDESFGETPSGVTEAITAKRLPGHRFDAINIVKKKKK